MIKKFNEYLKENSNNKLISISKDLMNFLKPHGNARSGKIVDYLLSIGGNGDYKNSLKSGKDDLVNYNGQTVKFSKLIKKLLPDVSDKEIIKFVNDYTMYNNMSNRDSGMEMNDKWQD